MSDNAIAALLLGCIERGIRAFSQLLRKLMAGRYDRCRADTDRNEAPWRAGVGDQHIFDCPAQAFADTPRDLGIGVVQQNGKFFATVACREIRVAPASANALDQ